ncbi:MAG: acyl-CoA dehydrogenase family protein [Deltaproteobacteria bacterium]
MDFGLSQEQVLLADTVGRYLADNCPGSRVRTVMESESGHDGDLWRGLMELGLGGIVVPEEFGGLGLEMLDLAIVAEELGYACTPGPFLASQMAGVALAAGDNGELKERWLPLLASGEAIGTVAVCETGERWDLDGLQTVAADDGLSGSKPLVPYASVADFTIVAASGPDGPGLWLVERGAVGVEAKGLKVNDMTRRLDAVELKQAAGERVGGDEAFAKARDAGLVMLAADAFGGSRRCLEMARDYALEREQFGQVIGAFQAVKHQLANMVSELEPARSLYWYAAHAYDRIPEAGPRHAALAKARLCDIFDRTARDSTELHGGIGFTWEFDLQLWFRRSIFDRSFLGDSSYHRARAADLAGW